MFKRFAISWDMCLALALVTLIIGVIVDEAVLRSLYFVPSKYDIKVFIHWVLALAWLPVLFVCFLLRPARGSWMLSAIVLSIGVVFFFYVAVLNNPDGGRPNNCVSESAPDGKVRYICFIGSDRAEFEVVEGEILMRYVGIKLH